MSAATVTRRGDVSPPTGRRVVITGRGAAVLEAQPLPIPSDGEVVVRALATLVSPGTELALYEGTHAALPDPEVSFAKYPFKPGYAAVGEVIAVGNSVKRLILGQKIFYIGPHASFHVFCPDTSIWADCPSDLPIGHVLLARLVQIASTATHVWRREPKRVLVLGAGLVGILAAQVCGIRRIPDVVVHDINLSRLELASRCGLATTAAAQKKSAFLLERIFSGSPPDCVVEATGVPELIPAALRIVGRGGDVVLLGSPRGSPTIDAYKFVHLKGVALIGAHETIIRDHCADASPSRQQSICDALEWARSGRLHLAGLVSQIISPEELPGMYAQMSADKTSILGIVVVWDKNDAGLL